jgi:hypothetical protein
MTVIHVKNRIFNGFFIGTHLNTLDCYLKGSNYFYSLQISIKKPFFQIQKIKSKEITVKN